MRLINGDCLAVMKELEDNSVDLIATDPPYYKVKGEAWDRQWDTADGFLEWLGEVLAQFHRLLRPNGSLYLFASPKMAARVEVLVGGWFEVLNHVVWRKQFDWHGAGGIFTPARCSPEALRGYYAQSERVIFAEHYGADSYAKGEAGYERKCDELRGFLFEPLRAYLDGERLRAGISKPQIDAAWCEWKNVGQTAQSQKWFSTSCWNLPTTEAYQWLRETFSRLNGNGEYLRREYEYLRREYEDLRREYEYLRQEYEELRRPFTVSADVPFTDVWTFKTVNAYPGKHPCEKPAPMMEHIVTASSKPGAVVLDAFMGTGSTGLACEKLGREFIGIEKNKKYYESAVQRIEAAQAQKVMF